MVNRKSKLLPGNRLQFITVTKKWSIVLILYTLYTAFILTHFAKLLLCLAVLLLTFPQFHCHIVQIFSCLAKHNSPVNARATAVCLLSPGLPVTISYHGSEVTEHGIMKAKARAKLAICLRQVSPLWSVSPASSLCLCFTTDFTRPNL